MKTLKEEISREPRFSFIGKSSFFGEAIEA
jgi:hypothetical protein